MKSSLKIGITVLVLVIATVAVISVFLMKNGTNRNLAVQTTPTPGVVQTATPTPKTTQATASPSVPSITISYSALQTQCGHYMIDIDITNTGYACFSTDPTKFSVTANGEKYTYLASLTKQFGFWNTTNVANQGTYEGTLIFSAPSTVTSAALGYNDTSYNIVYQPR